MKALLLRKQSQISSSPLQLVEIESASPTPNQLLVQVTACGICRTDLHVIEGDLAPKKLPLIPGHQVVGRVAALGSKCKKFKIGDRVGIAWLGSTCQSCGFCESGRENLCSGSLYTGYDLDGGYAEFAAVSEDYAYALPAALSDIETCPLLCAGIIGYRALKRSNLLKNGKLLIFGFGSSAHVTIQVARYFGAEVYVATRGEKHKRLAKEMGALWVGDTFDRPKVEVDSAIIFAPAGELVPVALQALRKGGTVISAGIHMSNIPEMKYQENIFHEKILTSVESNTREDGRELLELAAKIPIKTKVTVFPLSQANEALAQLKSDGFEGSGVLTLG